MAYEQLYQKLINVYGLSEDDFWMHKQSGKLIIKHCGVQKIAYQDLPNKTKIVVPELKNYVVHQTSDGLRGKELVISAQFELHHDGVCLRRYVSFGEANEKNLRSDYPWAIAEKRMFDRAVLALVGLAQEGVYSDEEADTFRDPKQKVKISKPRVTKAPTEAAAPKPAPPVLVVEKPSVLEPEFPNDFKEAAIRTRPVPMPPKPMPPKPNAMEVKKPLQDCILEFLEENSTKIFSRSEICGSLNMNTNDFLYPITMLITSGKVARSGEKRGTKYQLRMEKHQPLTREEYHSHWVVASDVIRDMGVDQLDLKTIVRKVTGHPSAIVAQQNGALTKQSVETIINMSKDLVVSQ